LAGYGVELGSDGRLLTLQLHELTSGIEELADLLEQDYRPGDQSGWSGFAGLESLDTAELLEPLTVARAMGFSHNEHPDAPISTRGYRQVAEINRLPTSLGPRLIEHFGSLQALFSATSAELQEVEGVGESRARVIRDGLLRLAESAYTERV
ncbi:MAG: DNA integrity scanning protein DisA, partial [Propionibacteriaceae bacterium]|nr:DNA integrity scanning protein DisA [Propionibacteriaceae bacterium]